MEGFRCVGESDWTEPTYKVETASEGVEISLGPRPEVSGNNLAY